MRLASFAYKGDLLGFVIIKFYKSLKDNIPSNIKKLLDDFSILIDIPFYSMALLDDNRVMFGNFEVASIDLNSIYVDYNQQIINGIRSGYTSDFYDVIYIKCNEWVLGRIDFYNKEAYEVLKGWLKDAET